MAASVAGLVETEISACLGAVFVCLACVGTRLPWVLGEIAAPFEKQFGPSAVYSKSGRAADPLCGDAATSVLDDNEEGGVLGAVLVGDEAGGVVGFLSRSPWWRSSFL